MAQKASDYEKRDEATHIGTVPEPRGRSSTRQSAARPAAQEVAEPQTDGETRVGVPAPTREPRQKPSRQAGAYSRRNTGEGMDRDSGAQPAEPEIKPIDPAVQRRLVIAGSVIASVLAALITGSVLLSSTRPSLEELRILYPYGYANTPLPGGVVRPGAYGVDFELLGPTPCSKNGTDDCLLFQFSGGNYSGTMAVRPGKHGWERVDSAPEASPPDRM
jgi:hypothetical protein